MAIFKGNSEANLIHLNSVMVALAVVMTILEIPCRTPLDWLV